MEFSKILLKGLNGLLSFFMAVVLCAAGAYSVYALWDNNQVYARAENVMAQMQELKPEIEESEDGQVVSFSDLLEINSDVCAWVTLDNTKINYPVLQGDTNLTYINTDIYGEFSLAGSIYLDSRNSSDFTDTYSLLYGHRMDGGRMFGDLDKYKEPGFLVETKPSTLMTPNAVYDLEVYACIVVGSSDNMLYNPKLGPDGIGALLSYVEQKALFFDSESASKIRAQGANAKILAFSTCSSEFTDARTILLAAMTESTAETVQ